MRKVILLLMVALVCNTASVALLCMAFLGRYSLLGMVNFTHFVTLAMLNYLGGTLIAFITLGIWKKGLLLGKVSVVSGVENIIIGLLFVVILLQDVVKAPIIILPFLTGYGLIQHGKRAMALEKIEGSA